jgi:hypothetical protein
VRPSTPSPWASEEGRDFLQDRIRQFARTSVVIASLVFIIGVLLRRFFLPAGTDASEIATSQMLHLGLIATFAAMWLSTRGAPLPIAVLLLIDATGTIAVCVAVDLMALHLPVLLRPDLFSLLTVMGILLYRAAIVPGDPWRAFWIGAAAAAPLPPITYRLHELAPPAAVATPPLGYALWVLVFCVLAVALSVVTSRVIYGLREKISEARRLGQYTLIEKIGEGGMGAVYRASHALLRRPTAVKLLPPERAGEIDLARFEREVQMTSLLTSPHIVSIYDYGRTPDGIFYYAMEYLDGIDLDELVRREGPIPPSRAVHILVQVCRALEEAHEVGLIHRDIKPANILLCERGGTPDVAKVVDFGLVKSLRSAGERGVTLENVVLGTPHYMPPEAISSPERVDARSDLYAVGAVAYFLLTGRAVFDGGSAMSIFTKHLRDSPVAPSERLGRGIPADLEALVLASLSKDPAGRPASARDFRESLASCRGVPAWTDAEAAAWWKERGRKLRRPGAETAFGPVAKTFVVDLSARR